MPIKSKKKKKTRRARPWNKKPQGPSCPPPGPPPQAQATSCRSAASPGRGSGSASSAELSSAAKPRRHWAPRRRAAAKVCSSSWSVTWALGARASATGSKALWDLRTCCGCVCKPGQRALRGPWLHITYHESSHIPTELMERPLLSKIWSLRRASVGRCSSVCLFTKCAATARLVRSAWTRSLPRSGSCAVPPSP